METPIREAVRHRDRPSRSTAPDPMADINFRSFKCVLRDEEHVRDQSSNTLCILHQIVCRLFESVLDLFPLQLNA